MKLYKDCQTDQIMDLGAGANYLSQWTGQNWKEKWYDLKIVSIGHYVFFQFVT